MSNLPATEYCLADAVKVLLALTGRAAGEVNKTFKTFHSVADIDHLSFDPVLRIQHFAQNASCPRSALALTLDPVLNDDIFTFRSELEVERG